MISTALVINPAKPFEAKAALLKLGVSIPQWVYRALDKERVNVGGVDVGVFVIVDREVLYWNTVDSECAYNNVISVESVLKGIEYVGTI